MPYRLTPVSVAVVLGILSFALAAALAIGVYLVPERRPFWADLFVLSVAVALACVVFLAVEAGLALFRRRLPPLASPTSGRETGSGPVVPVPADIHIRVLRDRDETGNAAGEYWRRWLHLKVENWSAHPVRSVRLRITVRPEDTERRWYWSGRAEIVDELRRGEPVAVPIVIGDRTQIPPPPLPKWAQAHRAEGFPVDLWFLTPKGHDFAQLVPIPSGRHFLDVTVIWTDGETTDWFLLDLPASDSDREPELIHIVAKDRY